MYKFTKLLLSLAIIHSLSACIPVLITGTGKVIGNTVVQEKSLGNTIDDANIWTKIKLALIKAKLPAKVINNISIKVLEGRVLLTGKLTSPDDKMEVVRIIWSQNGVKEVNDEIEIVDNNYLNIESMAKDTWITSQIKTKLLLNKQIRSVNYTVETINSVVYLFGIAQTENELNEVTQISRDVSGVEKVLSFVRIKNSPLRQNNNQSENWNNGEYLQ